jgi:site-specific recombinase XerC
VGTEEFWVPAVLAAVSAGSQYANTTAANNRQQAAEVNAINNQQQIRDQANQQVKQLTSQVAQNTPQQLQAQATGKYVQQLRDAAAGSTQGGSTTGNPTTDGQSVSALPASLAADPRYAADLKQSQQQVQQYGNNYAQNMGAIDAAVRQRQNEGLAAQTLGTNLNMLGAQSATQNFVDQLRAQAAGTPSPWVGLAGGIAGGAANALSKNPALLTGSGVSPYTTNTANQMSDTDLNNLYSGN